MFLFYVYECFSILCMYLCIYMYVYHEPVVPTEARRGQQILRNCNYRFVSLHVSTGN